MHAGLDLDAPILPGEAAGGCHLGQSIEELRASEGEWLSIEPVLDYRHQPTGVTIYRSVAVDLWVTPEGRIKQIGVHGSYRGTLFERVGLGMTIDDIERLVGPCAETIDDTLSIRGIRGLGFDVDWRPDHFIAEDLDFKLPELRFSPLTWFFISEEDEPDPWGGCDDCADSRGHVSRESLTLVAPHHASGSSVRHQGFPDPHCRMQHLVRSPRGCHAAIMVV